MVVTRSQSGGLASMKIRLARSVGEWRSLVAHLLWEQRVAGSNPVSPTILRRRSVGFDRSRQGLLLVLGGVRLGVGVAVVVADLVLDLVAGP